MLAMLTSVSIVVLGWFFLDQHLTISGLFRGAIVLAAV
jgi:hypothetical protein